MVHPRDALIEAGEAATSLPVCDHYAGVEQRMRKSLELQAQMGPVFDVTLDCEVDAIAAHPRIESISFGLMDFVSAHRGAIPAAGMSVQGQFSHPLVLRAKLEIAAACHAHGKTPSHSVVTEFNDRRAIAGAAEKACR